MTTENTELLDLLAAEPPAALIALALRQAAADPGVACRMAALGCALQAGPLDLTVKHPNGEPAAELAVRLEDWLAKVPADKELGIWCLHFACLMTGPENSADHVTDAAGWLHRWLSQGKSRARLFGSG